MLNTLDILIAFAVIMTVLSLIITILVQMVSSALALRGKNLANALALTFQTIDPDIRDHAHSLAAQILRDPIFSDSIWRTKSRVTNALTRAVIDAEGALHKAQEALNRKGNNPKKLLLEKALAAGKAAVATAEANLAKAHALVVAEQTLREAQRNLAENRDATRNETLKDAVTKADTAVKAAEAGVAMPAVKPNRKEPWGFWTWPGASARQLANAIRPGEIYRVLHEIGTLTPTEALLRDVPPELAKKAGVLLQALDKLDRPAIESRQKLRVVNWVSEFFKQPTQQQAVVDSLGNFGATVERATTQAYDRFQRWFGSGQDRAEQWFRTHMRIITIVMAALITVVLQLDTIQIFRKLRAQPKLVEALVKSAPDVLKEGGTVLDPTNTPAYYTYLLWLRQHPLFPLPALPASNKPEVYYQELAKRLKEKPDLDYPLRQFDNAFALALQAEGFSANTDAAAARPAYDAWIKQFPKYKLEPEPDPGTATKENIRAVIQQKITEDPDGTNVPDADNTNKWLADYNELKPAGTMAFGRARDATLNNLKNELNDAGFDLAPPAFLGRWDGEQLSKLAAWVSRCFVRCLPNFASGFGPFVGHSMDHFLGLFMTAGLLALGAPFWFNLLKNLMSLRPAVASLIEKRPNSAPALPSSPATPASPS